MKALSKAIKAINTHPLSTALAMLVLNIGSKYVEMRFSQTQEQLIRDNIGMEIFICAVLFTATKDLLLSIFITFGVVLLTDFFLNEKSRFCMYRSKDCA